MKLAKQGTKIMYAYSGASNIVRIQRHLAMSDSPSSGSRRSALFRLPGELARSSRLSISLRMSRVFREPKDSLMTARRWFTVLVQDHQQTIAVKSRSYARLDSQCRALHATADVSLYRLLQMV